MSIGKTGSLRRILKGVSLQKLPLSSRAEYFDMLGSVLQEGGNYRKAEKAYLAAFKICKKTKDQYSLLSLAQRLGDINRQKEAFLKARRWYAWITRNAKGIPKEQVKIWRRDAAGGQALCVRSLGRYKEAETRFVHLLKEYRRARDTDGEAFMLWAAGTTQRFLGKLPEAERNLSKSVALYSHLHDDDGLAYARCGLGGALRMRGMAGASGAYYRKAYLRFKKGGDLFGMAYSSCGQASAHRMQKQYSRAMPFFRTAIQTYRRLEQRGPLAFVLWGLAQQELATSRFQSARRHLNEAERLFQSVRDKRGMVYIYLGWGEYHRMRKNPKAGALFKKAFKLAGKLGLRLEMAHALSGVWPREARKIYKKIGVRLPQFLVYSAFP